MTLEYITNPALQGVKHGFFTRIGGASSGVFQGLNCGFGSSDQQGIVEINRNRVAKTLGINPQKMVGVHQIHSSKAVIVDDIDQERPQADALVTNRPGLGLCILTADCQPVLFADQHAGVIGAAHAGWKGALHGVLEATIDKMEALGADRKNINAVVGPAISQANYEVGPEFREDFITKDPHFDRFFAMGSGDRFLFDLPAFGLHRLRTAGIGQSTWTNRCTYAEPDRFFSYRRSVHRKEADYGRLISVISR